MIDDRDQLKRRLADVLERRTTRLRAGDDPRPVRAAAIARYLGAWPGQKHETQRRRVRELVEELRRDGFAIAADGRGYWRATTPQDIEAHNRFLRRMGLEHLANASQMTRSPAADGAAGQSFLFDMSRPHI